MALSYLILCYLFLGTLCSASTTRNLTIDGVQIIEDGNSHTGESGNVIPFDNVIRAGLTTHLTYGQRIPNDDLIGTSETNLTTTFQKNMTVVLVYPRKGESETISYVEIAVETLSGVARGKITDGNIGQTHIKIAIEGANTTFIAYKASIYGGSGLPPTTHGSAGRAQPFICSVSIIFVILLSNKLFLFKSRIF